MKHLENQTFTSFQRARILLKIFKTAISDKGREKDHFKVRSWKLRLVEIKEGNMALLKPSRTLLEVSKNTIFGGKRWRKICRVIFIFSLHHLSELTNFYQPIVVTTAQVTFICRCYMKAIRFFWRTLQLYPYHTCDIAFRCKVSRFRCKTLINCRGVSCNLSLKSPFWKVHLWFIIFIIIISIWTILETAQYESWHYETYS